MNPLELPEIVALVFDHLPVHDVFTCMPTCRVWYAEAVRPMRWPEISVPSGHSIRVLSGHGYGNGTTHLSERIAAHKTIWSNLQARKYVCYIMQTHVLTCVRADFIMSSQHYYVLVPRIGAYECLADHVRRGSNRRGWIRFMPYCGPTQRADTVDTTDSALLQLIAEHSTIGYGYFMSSQDHNVRRLR